MTDREIILVVDDNRQIADFIGGTMLPSLGYSALIAYSGENALDIIHKHSNQIDLIVLDLQLPDISGLDLLRELNKQGVTIPVILVTAHGSEEVAIDAFRLGVQDYLKKPIDMESLRESIQRALSESRLKAERERLLRELEDRVTWLRALSNVGRGVTSSLDRDTALERIVDAAVKLANADQGFIALLDDTSEKLQLRVVKNIAEDKVQNLRLPVTDPLIKQAFESGQAIRINRQQGENPLKVSTGLLVTNLIHVPLRYQNKTFGVLSVNNHTTMRDFTRRDEEILVSLGDYAAIAIENANLYQQAQEEIRQRAKVEKALRISEERYALAVAGANDGIWDWDLLSNKVYFSPRWKQMLGFTEEDIEDNLEAWLKLIHPDDVENVKLNLYAHIQRQTPYFNCEYRIRKKNGQYAWVLTRGLAVWDDDGKPIRMAGSQTDITERKNAEQQLLHDALHDALTGLPNRTLFLDRLKLAIERAKRREDYLFAVCMLDLDHFKNVNDSLGHLIGDRLLITVSNVLQQGLRSTDTLARFGGDEFVILLEDIRDTRNVFRITNWIHEKFAEPIRLVGHQVYITTSIGVVLSNDELTTPDEMLRDADIAMYVAKANGRARTEVFEPSMRNRVILRLSLENDLRDAIEKKQLEPYYQPIVSLADGKLIGFEALVRWNHPHRGVLNPPMFIPLAENTGKIVEIDRWMLRQACSKMRYWQEKYDSITPDLSMSVNISGKHITRPDFVDFITHVLTETKLAPQSLRLEITESTVVENNELARKVFRRLREMGVQVQIDDFGIGYSSLGYLSNFPVDGLKIDSSFVSRMMEDGNQMDIIQAIVMLTNRLNIRVIAEGVETADQLEQLRNLGCEFGQGYLVAMPLRDTQVELMLQKLSNGVSDQDIWALLKN